MTQVHRRFSDEQVRNLFRSYEEGVMGRSQVEGVLGISKTRFFALLKRYRRDPRGFSLSYRRSSPCRLDREVKSLIRKFLSAPSRLSR
jgi:hypothetical protein